MLSNESSRCPECGSPADTSDGRALCICDGPPPPREAYDPIARMRASLEEIAEGGCSCDGDGEVDCYPCIAAAALPGQEASS